MDNGLYRVHSGEGFAYTTHGPDFGSDLLWADSHGGSIDLGDPQRDIACATDYYQEVLYGYPSTGSDQLASKKADIQAMMQVNNAVLNEESLASGGPAADFKVRCDPRRFDQGHRLPRHARSGGRQSELQPDRQRGESSRLWRRSHGPKRRLLDLLRRPRALRCLRHGNDLGRRVTGGGKPEQQPGNGPGGLCRGLQRLLVHPYADTRERSQPGRGPVQRSGFDGVRPALRRIGRCHVLPRRWRPAPGLSAGMRHLARDGPLRLRLGQLLRRVP